MASLTIGALFDGDATTRAAEANQAGDRRHYSKGQTEQTSDEFSAMVSKCNNWLEGIGTA